MAVYVFKEEYNYVMKIPIYISVPLLFIIGIPLIMNLLAYSIVGGRVFRFIMFFIGLLVVADVISYIYVIFRYPYEILIDNCKIIVKNKSQRIILERYIKNISSILIFSNKGDDKGYIRINIYKKVKPIEIGNRLTGGGMADLIKLERLLKDLEKSKIQCKG